MNSFKLSQVIKTLTILNIVIGAGAASAGTLTCYASYSDRQIQEKPLYDESFEVDLAAGEGVMKQFLVSPGNGEYLYITKNRSNGDQPADVAIMIGQTKNSSNTIGLYDSSAPHMLLIQNPTPKSSLSVSCAPKVQNQ